MTSDQRLSAQAEALGYSFDGAIKVGGDYVPLIRDGDHIYLSGQIPRVGDTVVITGAVGAETTLAQAQVGARICAMRALTLLQRSLGSLERVTATPRMTVYVRSAPTFTQQSEVADAASRLLHEVIGPAGVHTRTSVGVAQLPKSASVEIDFIFKVSAG